MTDQNNAELIAEAREAAKRADWYMTGESPLLRALAAALEAAEQERDEARKAAEDHVLDADAVHVRLSAELRAAEQRAKEAERELQVAEDQANNLAGDLAQAEKERDALAAVVEKVREFAHGQATEIRAQYGATGPAGYLGFANACEDVLDILSSAPADTLRELKADVWDEGFDAYEEDHLHHEAHGWGDEDCIDKTWNPYRAREEQDRG